MGRAWLSYRPDADQEGYFLSCLRLRRLPESGDEVAKTVIFVVDKSGSMSGEKIEQARAAIKFVLNNLREGDTFNIVYDSSVESFRPELEKFNDETRQQALGYVEGLYAGGGTNIHEALSTALKQLQDDSRPSSSSS
ncbi:MAG: VWA domain-containing protein [Planctomycetaceae bacterium]